MAEKIQPDGPADRVVQPGYEPPKIEEIVTPAQLEREVDYAGRQVTPP